MIVITGASDGLGAELAKLYVADGKKVISLSRTTPSNGVEHIETDLSDPKSVDATIKQLLEMNEPIEALVNNAALQTMDPIGEQRPEAISKVLQVNVGAVVHLTSGLLKKIVADDGDIMIVTSNKAFAPFTRDPLYGTSQYAERGYSVSLQEELKESRTRVINFAPCGFVSRIVEKATGEKIADPSQWAAPKDIAVVMKQILELPKIIQVSEIILDRKAKK